MKNQNHIAPPRWADRLFKLLCPPELFEKLQGDMQEQFELDLRRSGRSAARNAYALEVLRFAKPFYLNKRLSSLFKPQLKPKANSHITPSQTH